MREVAKEIELEQQQILANLQRKQMQLNERKLTAKKRQGSSSSFDISIISQKDNNYSQNLNIVDEEPASSGRTGHNET